jgi:hypothetical protein
VLAVVGHHERAGTVAQGVGEHVEKIAAGLGRDTDDVSEQRHDVGDTARRGEVDEPRPPVESVAHPCGELDGQARLAASGWARQRDEAPLVELGGEVLELRVAPDERRQRRGQVARRRRTPGGDRERHRQLAPGDLGVELVQLGGRLQAELIPEGPPVPPEGPQRVGRSPRRRQGRHQQCPEPLAQRMLLDELEQLGRALAVPAEPHLGVESLLDGDEPQLAEPSAQRRREGTVGEVGEHVTPPHPLGLQQGGERAGRVTVPS